MTRQRSQPLDGQTLDAMRRRVAFWRREMSDQILAQFHVSPPLTQEHQAMKVEPMDGNNPPLYDDVPKMLREFESAIPPTLRRREIADDGIDIPATMPDLQFGNGLTGAMLGASLKVFSTATHTTTFNEPVVRQPSDLKRLRFDEDNSWTRRCLDCLRFFAEHARRPFLLHLMATYEGGNFVASLRGETQAIYDFADDSALLREMYRFGYEMGARFFEMRRDIVKPFNEITLGQGAFADLDPMFGLPWMDTDIYALCAPAVFERHGLEWKQKMIDRFGGGRMYIHMLGLHLVAAAGKLERLTDLAFQDDPKCPRSFERRDAIRQATKDTPLVFGPCSFKEFLDAMRERSLPGGSIYTVSVPSDAATADVQRAAAAARAYRAPAGLEGKG